MAVPDTPLTPEAHDFLSRVQARIQAGMDEVQKVPVSVLLWGPDVDGDNPLAQVRDRLRSELRKQGHLALFSEELAQANSDVSLRVQEFIQARNFDLVVCMPESPGALGEAHDFAAHPLVRCKMLVFLNQEYVGGYSEQSLAALSTVLSAQVEYFPNVDDTACIEQMTLEQVQRIRELKFMYSWKADL